MSKGSKRRPTNDEQFKENFDRIKWGSVNWTQKEKVEAKKVHHIMPDIEPYRAVAGKDAGKVITSRSKEREYLKRNNCIQVGNEKDYFFKHGGKTPDNPTRDW